MKKSKTEFRLIGVEYGDQDLDELMARICDMYAEKKRQAEVDRKALERKESRSSEVR